MTLSIEEKVEILNARILDTSRHIYITTLEKGAEEAASGVLDELFQDQAILRYIDEIARLEAKYNYFVQELAELEAATPPA